MTGFGQAKSNTPNGRFVVEIKSVNNRFAEVQIRVPRVFSAIEGRVRKFVTDSLPRGSVYVGVYFVKDGEAASEASWNRGAVAQYVQVLREVKKRHRLDGEIDIRTVAGFAELFSKDTAPLEEKAAWNILRKPLAVALQKVQFMRQKEGTKLCSSIRKHHHDCSTALRQIRKRAPARLLAYRRKLEERIKDLAAGNQLDPSRMAMEVGFMAERMGIDEECVRLESHLQQFGDTLGKGGNCIGKRLNFLLQEMNREANTISSKANDAVIALHSVHLKEKIEMIREQVQNIE